MTGSQQHDERRPDRAAPDIAALVIAFILAAVSIAIAWSTAYGNEVTSYSPVGPKTVPYVVAAGLFGLAIWTVIEALRGDFPEREHQEIAPMAWIIGGLAIQMLTMKTAGFSLATGLLFAATARGFGYRKFWISVPAGIIFAFVIWFIFARGLQLSLPSGWLERFV
ncbi:MULTISPECIES: tripartite tricarboxylate transporter TctB family protein [Brucella/Ochrobactrum group]|uniref:Tripartite tricarboxylate transporter TctB family protein n=2 Tax=Ochrobactrum TaxID=528 RepID=A0ABD5JTM8_9HYPH|nr:MULTISPECIES: tripartite tricarboxylate transporter TctB family protein [Brucella]MCI1000628.1 tripartite tricarboxylate transporter TctB family protein [Ochrobactrum sp. C6C9]RRD24636.1 tripartite tricarboxylate transporter TctB family protein [Brucellaceae bacterium VT-16-1752]WHT43142.1 tripartite tricarboxylate transporter TctB family protein [Ochrobactrum sp. SSR]MDX4075193.1 tripartite tricarboxylate transporter TctB family protein [Brucella sp. NBRC 113783]RLL74108.1 tripartite trica